jgi:lipopolysaccharide/colanic/teichoic acid biosynthesis glycosyltransferase
VSYTSTLKRCFDLVASAFGLLAVSPLLFFIALCIKLSDWGPVFFVQERIGWKGVPFKIIKFRTMILNAERFGLSITKDGDPRVTRCGKFLRKTKLDELPQLFNVLLGQMSFVGPRPEVARYVANYTAAQRMVLHIKPGITDLATLEFRNEEALLSEARDAERFYKEFCVPRKIELNLDYSKRANLWEDLKIILRTLFPVRKSNVIVYSSRSGKA